MAKRMVRSKRNRRIMMQYNYPMNETTMCAKIGLRDMYVKHAYYIQGHGKTMLFFKRTITDYAEAHSFQRENSKIIYFYILTVPIIMIWEYILQKSGTIMVGGFNLRAVFRLYIFLYTFIATTCLQTFAKSFSQILPFINFDRQLSSLVYIKTFFDF